MHILPNLKTQKKEIIFAICILYLVFILYEDIVAFHLNKLAVKNKIKFNILPRFRNRSLKKLNKEKYF